MENAVNEKLCNERSGNFKTRLDKHSEEIDDVKAAVIKLTQIVEQMEKKASQSEVVQKVTFWQTKAFEWLIKSGCIIATLLTMAAIGMNYFKEYLQAVIK